MRSGPATIAVVLLLAARLGAADFDASTAANQVGLDLYRQLAAVAPARNLALSPYSIESALALAYAGADGQTRTEMARVLYFPEDDQSIETAFGALRGSLNLIASKSGQQEKEREKWGGRGDAIEWHEASRLFGQQGYAFRSSFLGLLQDGYGTPFAPVDFRNHAEEERLKINAWVEDQTKNKIRDLIPEGGIDPRAGLVLVNALYLKASWASSFVKHVTSDLPFYPGGERNETVPTMRKTANFDYAKGDGFTAIALPYLGGGLQLLILLPDDRDGLGSLTAKLTPALFRTYAHLGSLQLITLYLPKFRLEGSTIDLAQNLEALGMKAAFDQPRGSANFNRAAPRRPDDYLYLSKVFHQTFIAVDEEGTEAAAGTAVVVNAAYGVEMNPPKPIEVHVDHPFFFAVQDRTTGVCLFFGSVADPR